MPWLVKFLRSRSPRNGDCPDPGAADSMASKSSTKAKKRRQGKPKK